MCFIMHVCTHLEGSRAKLKLNICEMNLTCAMDTMRWRITRCLPMQTYPQDGTLVVELNRTGGDPVLFLKRHDEGFARYGVPSFHDFDLFADTSSYQDRLNYHSIVLQHAMQVAWLKLCL